MGKIYNANGGKMGLAEICEEIQQTITTEQKNLLAENIRRYDDVFQNSQMKLAHAILDTYRSIDSTSEQGVRMRKLLDNIMTKYQKSTPANANDQAIYYNLICRICE